MTDPSPPFEPPVPPAYLPSVPAEVFLPPPARPRVWTVFLAFVVAFLVGAVVQGLVAVTIVFAVYGPDGLKNQERLEQAIIQPVVLLPTLLATQVVLAGVALCGGLLSPMPLRRRLRLGKPRLRWHGYVVLTLGTIALGYTSGIVIELLGLGDKGVLEEFERAIAGLRGTGLLLAALVIGLSPAVGEELLFRGYIQTRLRQRWPRLVALGVTSVLFGIIHFDYVQGTMAVFLGMWLGEMTDRTGSVWPAVMSHAVNNAAATVMGALLGPEAQAVSESPAWELAVTVPLFALCLLYLLLRPVVRVEDAVSDEVQAVAVEPAPPMAHAE